MNIFSSLLNKTMGWAQHPHAKRYLAGVSCTEAAFFPIPPDVLLIPMTLARPQDAWRLAWLATWTAVVGSLLGYAIGYLAIDFLLPYFEQWGYQETYLKAKDFFTEYGIWAVLIGSFTPIPFKIFTVTAGAMDMALLPFILIAFVGRAKRFYIVAAIMKYGGVRAMPILQKYTDALGWMFVGLIVLGMLIWQIWGHTTV
jgi:membrane protein YqaA with SNARE-associated domain